MPAPKVFISYRRSDSSTIAGRIYDRLCAVLGEANIFKDSYNIHIGDDFRGAIRDGVGQCDVVLVIIGKSWLTVTEKNNPELRRLDNPDDWVRIEVETGLQRQANNSARVIPVLVQGAAMPTANELPASLRELAPKQAATVRDDPDFPRDIKDLIDFLQKLNPDADSSGEPKTVSSTNKRLLEAAMPACSTLGMETQLKVKVSLLESAGLKAELPEVLPSGDIIQKGDVLATRFTMRFPKDASGDILPGTVCIEVVSDDFNVSLARPASKNSCADGLFELRVPTDDDSRTLNFRLTPKSTTKVGLSTLYVSVYQNDELITDTSVPTHIVRTMSELPICGDWRLNTAKAVPPQQQPQAPSTETGEYTPAVDEYLKPPVSPITQSDWSREEQASPSVPATSSVPPRPQPFAGPGPYLYQPSKSRGMNTTVISALVGILLVAFAVILLPRLQNPPIASAEQTQTAAAMFTSVPTATDLLTPTATHTERPTDTQPVIPTQPATVTIISATIASAYPCEGTIVVTSSPGIKVNQVHTIAQNPSQMEPPVSQGEKISILEKFDKTSLDGNIWYRIRYDNNNSEGWMTSEFVTVSKSCPA